MPPATLTFVVAAPEESHTVAKVLRSRMHAAAPSWADVKALVEGRRVLVNDTPCTDPARRLKEGETVELLASPQKAARGSKPDDVVIRYLDEHIVVVEKAAGINTVRHPAELAWPEKRRQLDPTLQDLARWAIANRVGRPALQIPPVRIVQRLDRETSGLVVFARTVVAERGLGLQFRKHTVRRKYLTVVPGYLAPQTIRSTLARDRGDGRRGSTPLPDNGKHAVTHVTVEETFPGYTLLSCRLETGRTHQIRIHLAETGHPVCGDKVYVRKPNGEMYPDTSLAPRLALHATELGFAHPVTGAELHWEMPFPPDLAAFVDRVRGGAKRGR